MLFGSKTVNSIYYNSEISFYSIIELTKHQQLATKYAQSP